MPWAQRSRATRGAVPVYEANASFDKDAIEGEKALPGEIHVSQRLFPQEGC